MLYERVLIYMYLVSNQVSIPTTQYQQVEIPFAQIERYPAFLERAMSTAANVLPLFPL